MIFRIACIVIISLAAILCARAAARQRARADRLNALVGVLRTGHDELLDRLEYEHKRRLDTCAKLDAAVAACMAGDATALLHALRGATDVASRELDESALPAQNGAP